MKGRELPQWYLDEPVLLPSDGFYLKAFGELNTCRGPTGFGISEIPWTAIVQYGHHVGLEDDMIDALVVVIRKMDEKFRSWHEEQAKIQAKAQKK